MASEARRLPEGAGSRASLAGELIGGAAVAAAAVQFGAAVVLGKVAVRRGLPIPSMLAVRFAVAAVVLAGVLVVLRRPIRGGPGETWRLFLLGGVGYGIEAGFFFAAVARGTAAAVSLLFFTYPVWVTLARAALGGGVPGLLLGGSLVAAVAGAGIVVASSGGVDITAVGIVFALVAAVTFAAYLLAVDAVLRRSSTLSAAMWVSAGASLGLGGFGAATGMWRLPAGGVEWAPVGGMGLVTAGAFLGLFIGLRRLGAVRASIVGTLEPVATAALAFAFLAEPLRAGTVIGGILIVAAAAAASVARRPPEAEPGIP